MMAVTFDYGQTLAELHSALLAARAGERGVVLDPDRLDAASLEAWGAYNAAKRAGMKGEAAWKAFMRALLTGAAVPPPQREALVDWLWLEQPRKNLWRRPIPGMLALVRELGARGVPVGVLSNSEGHLAELVAELGWTSAFDTITDSGTLPFEKPDPRIFTLTAERLGVATTSLIHVGDAWEADVRGAVAVGARAVYFSPNAPEEELPGVATCRDAAALRAQLVAWGVPL